MKKIIALILLAGWFGSGMMQAADAAKDATSAPFTVVLLDGSQMKATLGVANFTLATDLGTITIPVEKVRLITLQADAGTAVFRLVDGDQLTGKLDITELPVTTLMGYLKLKLANVTTIVAQADLNGAWLDGGKSCKITQVGDTLKLVTPNGLPGSATLSDDDVITAYDWHITAKVSDDGKSIHWSNGSLWTRPSDNAQK